MFTLSVLCYLEIWKRRNKAWIVWVSPPALLLYMTTPTPPLFFCIPKELLYFRSDNENEDALSSKKKEE